MFQVEEDKANDLRSDTGNLEKLAAGAQPARVPAVAGILQKFQVENLESLVVLEGNPYLRAQGKAQLLKQLLDGIEKETPATAQKEE